MLKLAVGSIAHCSGIPSYGLKCTEASLPEICEPFQHPITVKDGTNL